MRRGQSLLEVVIALGIFAIGTAAVLILINDQFTTAQSNERALRAMLRAEEGLEAVRTIRNRNWADLSAGAHGLALSDGGWGFSGSSDTSDGLTRTVTVAAPSATVREVTSSVAWEVAPGRPRSLALVTRFTDWRSLGGGGISGDWTRPITLGSIDLGAGVVANGIAVRDRIVFIAASASAAAKSDLFIVDASDGRNPRVLSGVNTGPGLNKVAIAGNYAYVANRSKAGNQLQVIDISNLSNPRLVLQFTPVGANDAEGLSIAVVGTTVYLGLGRGTAREFQIIDAANLRLPLPVGSLEIDGNVSDIMVRGQYAYLATSRDNRELMIVNVSNPRSPALTGSFDAPGESEDGQGVDVHEDEGITYLARSVGGNHADHHEFHIINTKNPALPARLGSLDIAHDVNAISAVGDLAFLATDDANNEFKVYRIDDPANILFWGSLNFPQVASDIAFEQNVVYVAVRSNDALRIITSQ